MHACDCDSLELDACESACQLAQNIKGFIIGRCMPTSSVVCETLLSIPSDSVAVGSTDGTLRAGSWRLSAITNERNWSRQCLPALEHQGSNKFSFSTWRPTYFPRDIHLQHVSSMAEGSMDCIHHNKSRMATMDCFPTPPPLQKTKGCMTSVRTACRLPDSSASF